MFLSLLPSLWLLDHSLVKCVYRFKAKLESFNSHVFHETVIANTKKLHL